MSAANELGSAASIGGKLNWSKCLHSAGVAALGNGAGTLVIPVPYASLTNVLVQYGWTDSPAAVPTTLTLTVANAGLANAAFTLTSSGGAGDDGKKVWWQVWANQ